MPQIIDGYRGEPHVEAEDIWHSNVAIFGPGLWRTDEGGQCDVTLANNNTVTIANGIIIADGIRIRVPAPENVSIANGVVGMNRIDLIILRYTKDPSTSIMDTEWKVIQGQSTAGTPEEPAYTPGDVLNGATVAEWVYSSVQLNGLTVSQPEVRAKILKSYPELCDSLSQATKLTGNVRYTAVYSIGPNSYAEAKFTIPARYEVVGLCGYSSGNKFITVSEVEARNGSANMTLYNETDKVINSQTATVVVNLREMPNA